MAKMTRRKLKPVKIECPEDREWVQEVTIPGGHTVSVGDMVRTAKEPGTFRVHRIVQLKNGDEGWIDCYGGHHQYASWRSFALSTIRLAPKPRTAADKGKKRPHAFPGSFGDAFRKKREAAKLNRTVIADRAGLSVSAVSSIETKREPTEEEQAALSDALKDLA